MKYLYSITITLLLACGSTKMPITIGMPEQQFLNTHKNAKLVETSISRTVYKTVSQPFGQPLDVKFYYFKDGKLFKMDQGRTPADINIEVSK